MRIARQMQDVVKPFVTMKYWFCFQRVLSRNESSLVTIMKRLLIIAGFLCVGLGFLGIFLPLLPTTPLLLLAAFCFANSSERFHRWLLHNRLLGPYIRDYLEKGGVSLRVKITAISLIWISIGYCTAFLLENSYLRVLLLVIAAGVSMYLLRLPTISK
jgi:hypothetical protein